jgi:serine phosphatase RsbU (regulator of sigma subunit)
MPVEEKSISAVRQFALILGFVALSLVVSGVLYSRSRSADFDRHAQALEAIGNVRHLNELLSERVLAARFGLLNEYDPITQTELGLATGVAELRTRLANVLPTEGALDQALRELDASATNQRTGVERFKRENSVLKNSLYYLPTAARELAAKSDQLSAPLNQLAEAALVYNLVGDRTAQAAYSDVLARISAQKFDVSAEQRSEFGMLLAHARVIADRQPIVDRSVKQVVDSDVSLQISAVERIYYQRFGNIVASSNHYRKVLSGWSLVLVLLVGGAGFQLRRLYAGLEQRVAERTSELSKALAALWGEMKLARKIQEALVPPLPKILDCEVAASMKATEEVGGDYYDVVHTPDAEWILIGDVSGHGVPAGLIMMMCQTAVRTVLASEPTIMPDRLLTRVNTVLTTNIRQLGEDKYMTISAFRRDRDGSVTFAGAHQDIFIYRAETQAVEVLETHGIWLGLKEQIGHALSSERFRLAPGDVMLLLTDGITEAARNGKMFDTIGVRRVLDRAHGMTAQQILSALFTDLADFELRDDATVLVIRQLGPTSKSAAPEKLSEALSPNGP